MNYRVVVTRKKMEVTSSLLTAQGRPPPGTSVSLFIMVAALLPNLEQILSVIIFEH